VRDGVDAAIRELLDRVEASVGSPTCGAGCDRCCSHSVPVTSAEGLDLLAHLDGLDAAVRDPALARVRERARTSKLDPCPLLSDGLCTAYAARPVPCRTQHVWHEARYCDAPDADSCTPAEFLELRYLDYLDGMIEEADAGRLPFSGELGLVLTFLSGHADAYRSGGDLRRELDPEFVSRLRYPPGATTGEMGAALRRLREEEAERFRTLPAPLGMPRALEVRGRSELMPFFRR